jgi:hypothetical protein
MLRRLAALYALTIVPAQAAIVVDGRLDEPEWQQAQRFDAFRTTEPLTLAEPELRTEVLVYSDERGLYFGFICDQPPDLPRDRNKGARDEFVPGDRVNLMIDFEGAGTTAYEFTAYLGGGKQDAIISRQISYSYDWDGDWSYAAAETPTQWFIEYHLPWNVAPMGALDQGRQKLGVFFSRVVVASGRRYSFPAHDFNRATFVADMQPLRVAGFARAQLDLLPYIAASYDALAERDDQRAGFDLFWKPGGPHQLTATVNPDFGQVEADELVVNFSAIPTLFPEKRPFFTENQGLFTTETNLVYTRRIGARPDAGPEGITDILGALKYTGRSGALDYGLFSALEDDSSAAEGRDYFVGRLRFKASERLRFGWIGTHVERPSLQRRADVHGIDFSWTLAPGISLSGLATVTHVERPETVPRSSRNPLGTGHGGFLTFRHATGGNWLHTVFLTSTGDNWFINDAGFAARNNLHRLQPVSGYTWRDFADISPWQEISATSTLTLRRNDRNEQLTNFWTLDVIGTRRDTRYWQFTYVADGFGGVDDIVTRGNGNVRDPTQHRFLLGYGSPTSGLFRYFVSTAHARGNFGGRYHQYTAEPGLYFGERLSVLATLEYIQSADELIWQGGSLLGSFDYEQIDTTLSLGWYPQPRHELRLKFQWTAASGAALQGYRPGGNARLMAVPDPVDDFSQTETALQLRYRFELGSLSELFAVYSRGGAAALDEPERHLGSALRRGLAEETASQFLLKLRYRFALGR